MTNIDLAAYQFRGRGPSRAITKACNAATGYLDDSSLVLLKSESEGKWFLYNDSKDVDVHVRVRFRLPRRDVEAARAQQKDRPPVLPVTDLKGGNTVVRELMEKGASKGGGDYVYIQAVATVFAQETKPFLAMSDSVGAPEVVFDFEREPAGMDPSQVTLHGGADPGPALLRSCKRVYPCFPSEGARSAGMLYRLVLDKSSEGGGGANAGGEVWAFYNDSEEYNMSISATFTDATEVKPLGRTCIVCGERDGTAKPPNGKAAQNPYRGDEAWIAETDGGSGGGAPVRLELTVPPRSTSLFMEGTLSHQPDLSFVASAISNEEPEFNVVHLEGGMPDPSIIEYDQLFKCYPDKGNGLLFRLVDTNSKRWAFYNDTAKWTFNVTAVFPPPSEDSDAGEEDRFEPGPSASLSIAGPAPSSRRAASATPQTSNDAAVRSPEAKTATAAAPPPPAGHRVLTMSVPPGQTLLFLAGGLPTRYQLSYVKERAASLAPRHRNSCSDEEEETTVTFFDDTNSVDEDEIDFAGPGPDRALFPYAKIYRTLDPKVFRLVNEKGDAWGFYNDSQTTHAFVAAKFTGTKGAFLQDLSPGVAPLGRAALLRVQRRASGAASRLDANVTLPSPTDSPSVVAYLSYAKPGHASREVSLLSTPGRHSSHHNTGANSRTSSWRGEGSAAASSSCPEVYVTVGCGETQPFAEAVKLHALRRYLLFIRADPAPNAQRHGGNGCTTAVTCGNSGEEGLTYAHPTAAAHAQCTVKADRILPCFHDLDKQPLLFHTEEVIPSPTLAAAAARQPNSASAVHDSLLLTAEEENTFLVCRPVRWSLLNDTGRFTFVVTYQLDSRSKVKALGHTRSHLCTSNSGSTAPIVTHSALSAQPSFAEQASLVVDSPLAARAVTMRLEVGESAGHTNGSALGNHHQHRSVSLADIPITAVRSPLDKTIDEVYYTDFALENSSRQLAAREGSSGALQLYTTVVDPLRTVPVLEGNVAGAVKLVVRVDEARENHLISFNNSQPRIFTSESQFLAWAEAAKRGGGGSGKASSSSPSSSPAEGLLDNMLERPQLRFYRLMPHLSNGLLFRIVDDASGLWSFFNDTPTYRFTVRVLFFKGSVVEAAGNARNITAKARREAHPSSLAPGSSRITSKGKSPPQRRLSESNTAAATSEWRPAESPCADASFNFFRDPAYEEDETAVVIEVDVAPGDTELLMHAIDVVRFRVAWSATPLAAPVPSR